MRLPRLTRGIARARAAAATLFGAALAPAALDAQPGPPRTPYDTLVSPVVAADGRVTFQLYAPGARAVTVRSEGPAPFADRPMARGASGVWTLVAGPLAPDRYIYWYDVDGLTVADPRNATPRVNRTTVRSFLDVPGPAAAFHAERAVPHGAVAQVWYQSASLGVPRRMHVYTPPGYGSAGDTARYPVFYLLHGAGDTDESWPTVGRAGFILDNLVAEGRARPMIVVMPAGHTPRPGGLFGPPGAADPFVDDFLRDVVPYVERHYRTRPGREHRAIAGLSMGGWQTLQAGLTHLDQFSHVGVFSSGFLGDDGPARFERANRALLDDPQTNARLRVFWWGIGRDDFLFQPSKASLAMLDRHGVRYTYRETDGGHSWPNWRAYLREFAPLLFR